MALCSLTTRKVDIPHEPGEWIEVRPLSSSVLREVMRDTRAAVGDEDSPEYGYELTARMLRVAVVAWSYEPLPSDETIGDLDLETTKWLAETISGASEVPLPSSSPSTASSPVTETV